MEDLMKRRDELAKQYGEVHMLCSKSAKGNLLMKLIILHFLELRAPPSQDFFGIPLLVLKGFVIK